MMFAKAFPIAAMALAAALTATALRADDKPVAFAPAVDEIITNVLRPGYAALEQTASAHQSATQALCNAPSGDALEAARISFADLLAAWSRVELIRFGPARDANRFEKLFYWPDRKGRGLRQVQAIIAKEDETATTAERLAQKSVAVQGLPAMEFVLFGSGSETLANEAEFRCTYAMALSGVVAMNARAMSEGWEDSGYASQMRNAGKDAQLYKSHGEAVQAFLQAAREQVQIVHDLKIKPSLGKDIASAKPKRGPFWRSGQTLASIDANLQGVENLIAEISSIIPEKHARHVNNFDFELKQAKGAIERLSAMDRDWIDLVTSEAGYQQLSYVLIPLTGTLRVLNDAYPPSLGLTLGFNSLDGD